VACESERRPVRHRGLHCDHRGKPGSNEALCQACEGIGLASPGTIAGVQDREPEPWLNQQHRTQFRTAYRIGKTVFVFEIDHALPAVGVERTMANEVEDVNVSFLEFLEKLLSGRTS
jgi:hypothetical protein